MRRAPSLVTALALAVIGCSSDLTVPYVPEAGGPPEAPDAGAPEGPHGQDAPESGGDVADAVGEAGDAVSDVASDVAVLAPDDYDSFSLQFSRLYCRRVFSCCNVTDRVGLIAMDDEAACVRDENDVVMGVGDGFITRGVSLYNRDAATACLTVLTNGACSAVFSQYNGRLVACQGGVLKGLQPNGSDCEGDVECLSGRCTGNGCAAAPAPLCTSGEFFEGKTAMCVPRRQLGGDCLNGSDCVPGLTCIASRCAVPLADGQTCSMNSECAGACTSFSGGVCRPAICGG